MGRNRIKKVNELSTVGPTKVLNFEGYWQSKKEDLEKLGCTREAALLIWKDLRNWWRYSGGGDYEKT